MSKPLVARLHLRSTAEGVDHIAIEDWCLEGEPGWAGLGWGFWDETLNGIPWTEYVALKQERGDGVNESVRRLQQLPMGSLLWTRRRDSSYWIGELTGPWEYRDGSDAQRLDMFNVRPCQWKRVGTQDSVPGVVVSNFGFSKSLASVANRSAVRYTQKLWSQLLGQPSPDPACEPTEVLESLLGALDLEDLIAVYLQDRYGMILVNRRRSTVGYEFVLRYRDDGRRAVATVKSGKAKVDLDALPSDTDLEVWAYAVSGDSTGEPRSDVRWISTSELVGFILARPSVLPDQVSRWLCA